MSDITSYEWKAFADEGSIDNEDLGILPEDLIPPELILPAAEEWDEDIEIPRDPNWPEEKGNRS